MTGKHRCWMSPRNTLAWCLFASGALLLGRNTSRSQPVPVQPMPYFTFNYGVKDVSPDGKYVLTSEGMWSLEKKQWVWQTWFSPAYKSEADPFPVRLAVFSPDGKRILAWRETYHSWQNPRKNRIWVVEAATGKTASTFEMDRTSVPCLGISPDGKHVFVGGGRIEVWDISRGKKVRELEGGVGALIMRASPDGKYLFCGGRKANGVTGMVQMWDVSNGKELWQADEHVCDIRTIAFSPDGKQVMSAGDSAFLQLRDVRTGKRVQALRVGVDQERDTVWSAIFDRTGQRVMVSSGGAAAPLDASGQLWDLESGAVVRKLAASPQYLLPGGERGLHVQSAPGGGNPPAAAAMTFTIVNLRDGAITEAWKLPFGSSPARLK